MSKIQKYQEAQKAKQFNESKYQKTKGLGQTKIGSNLVNYPDPHLKQYDKMKKNDNKNLGQWN